MPFRENIKNGAENSGIGIDLVDDCNIRCLQCFYKKSTHLMRMLSLKQMKEIIKNVSGKFTEMYVLGGEPTLHPHLAEILELGLSNFSTVILVTNGLKLADEKYCKRIALPGLNISMHRRAISHNARRLLDGLAQHKGYFDHSWLAWQNVEKFWQGTVNVQLNLLKPLVDGGHVMDVFGWSRGKGYEPIMELTKPGPVFERGHELDVSQEEIEQLFEEMQVHDDKYHPQCTAKALVPPSYGHNCTLSETGIHVFVDGTVVPCIAHAGLALGNIFKDDVETILNSPMRKAIRDYRNWIVGPCRKCQYFEYCHGGCRGEAIWDTGCPRASDPYCWHIPKGLTLEDMAPISCKGCILENHPGCKKRYE